MKIATKVKLLMSIAEELKKVATVGGALLTFLLGDKILIKEAGVGLAIIFGWWLVVLVVAHVIMALASEIDEGDKGK